MTIWGLEEKQTLTGVGDVWRESIDSTSASAHTHTCTWSFERQAKIVLHSCTDGWKLFLTKTRRLLARRGLIHESRSHNPNNTTQMLHTHLNPKNEHDIWLLPDKRFRENFKFNQPTSTAAAATQDFNPRRLTAGEIWGSLWMSGSAKWISFTLMKMSSQICRGAGLLFTPFLPNTYAGVPQGMLR